jgi:tetratricopeptide (TPR) repeat protein
MVAALLGAGDVTAAREEAERWRAAMPGNDAPLFWLARVALADENQDSARSLLAIAGDGEGLSSGLLARGEAELLAGNLGNATAQLDRALALRPGDPTATMLRARVDLAANDAAAVEARLTPLHESGVAPEAGAVLGEALRRLGQRARSRAVLEETLKRLAAAGARPAQTAGATVALARLDHDEGRLAEAQEAVARVLAARPRDVPARLLSAKLLYDLGDAQSARAALDNLAVTAHADPEVLIEAARLHSLTGDPAGARQLLDDASKLAGASPSAQARESARLALVEGRAQDAVDLLAGESGDDETTLLLLDARLQIAGSDLAAAEAVAADASRRFAGQAVESVAAGQVALARHDGLAAARGLRLGAGPSARPPAPPPRELAETHLLLGQAHELAGAPDEAMASYQRAAKLTPSARRLPDFSSDARCWPAVTAPGRSTRWPAR